MIKQILKFLFAFALLYWLYSSGKLKFDLIGQSLNHQWHWFFCFLFLIGSVLITTLRWKSILEIKSKIKFTFPAILKLTWIGLMFNTALPGAVSGDIIKLVYAKNLDRSLDKTFLVTSVIFDRIIGLFGLLTLLGIFSIINYADLTSKSNELTNMVHFNFLLVFGMIIFLVILFLPAKIQDLGLTFARKIPIIKNHLAKTLEQVWLIGRNKKLILITILLSVICHVFNIMAFWTLAKPFITSNIPTRYAFSFIPIGFLTLAIPIAPAGLGVGHAVFDKLFSYFGQMNGASLFNFQFLATVIVNLCGVFPYLFHRDKSLDNKVLED